MDPITIAMGLAQFAPGIIKLLSGSDRAADVAAHVVGVAQAITGAPDGPAALQALQADPGKVLDFQQAMAAQQIDLEKAYLADRADARHMQETALAQEDLFSKRFVYFFSAAWSAFAMVYFFAVTFVKVEAAGQRVADTILGVLIATVLGSMMAYFYGTTKNSMEKTRLLAQSGPPVKA